MLERILCSSVSPLILILPCAQERQIPSDIGLALGLGLSDE